MNVCRWLTIKNNLQLPKLLRAKFCVNKKLFTIVYLLNIVFLREKNLCGRLPQVISVEWNWTFSRGNCRRLTDLFRVLLTIKMRIPSILTRVSGSLSQDISPSDLSHPVAELMIRLKTSQLIMSGVGLQLWCKGTSPGTYIYISVSDITVYIHS